MKGLAHYPGVSGVVSQCRPSRSTARRTEPRLVLNNTISHKLDYKPMSCVKVVYANRGDPVHPTDGLITAFRACFLGKTFSKLIQEIKSEEELPVAILKAIYYQAWCR